MVGCSGIGDAEHSCRLFWRHRAYARADILVVKRSSLFDSGCFWCLICVFSPRAPNSMEAEAPHCPCALHARCDVIFQWDPCWATHTVFRRACVRKSDSSRHADCLSVIKRSCRRFVRHRPHACADIGAIEITPADLLRVIEHVCVRVPMSSPVSAHGVIMEHMSVPILATPIAHTAFVGIIRVYKRAYIGVVKRYCSVS